METICNCGGIRARQFDKNYQRFRTSVDGIRSRIHVSKQTHKLCSLDNDTDFDTDRFFFKFMLYWTKQWPCPVQHEWILLVLVTIVSIDVLQYKCEYIFQIPQTLCVMTRPQCYQRRLLGYGSASDAENHYHYWRSSKHY
jgi:hypothetical protein